MVPALLHAANVGFSIFDRAERCQVGGLLVKGGSAAGSWRWAGSSHASLFPKCISKLQPMAGGLVELGMLVGASAGGDRGGVLMNLTTQCSCMTVGAGDGSLQLEAEGQVCVDCVHQSTQSWLFMLSAKDAGALVSRRGLGATRSDAHHL
jgi:hypothetical protein